MGSGDLDIGARALAQRNSDDRADADGLLQPSVVAAAGGGAALSRVDTGGANEIGGADADLAGEGDDDGLESEAEVPSGGQFPAIEEDSSDEEFREYMRLVKRFWDGALPSRVKVVESEIDMAVYAMPTNLVQSKAKHCGMVYTGLARLPTEDGAGDVSLPYGVNFCSCCAQGEVAWDLVQLYHSFPKCTGGIVPPNCLHARALIHLLAEGHEMDPAELCLSFAHEDDCVPGEALVWKRASDQDKEAPEAWMLAHVDAYPGRAHRVPTQELVQVGLWGSPGMQPGLVIGGKCQVCAIRRGCLHTRMCSLCVLPNYEGGDGGDPVEQHDDVGPGDHDDINLASQPSSFFRMPIQHFNSIFTQYVDSDAQGLKLSCISAAKIPFDASSFPPTLIRTRQLRNDMKWPYWDGLRDPCPHNTSAQLETLQEAAAVEDTVLCGCSHCQESADQGTSWILACDDAVLFHLGSVIPGIHV